MPHRYTDVDRMIQSRWTEVVALREAFSELLDRTKEVIDDALGKVAAQSHERGYLCEYDARAPSIWFWKKEWAARTSKEPGVYLIVSDFAPAEYGKVQGEHPDTTLHIDQLSRLKIHDREAFARELKSGLGPELRAKWEADGGDLKECPLGIVHRTIDEAERIRWTADIPALIQFLTARLDDCVELTPAIERALAKCGRA